MSVYLCNSDKGVVDVIDRRGQSCKTGSWTYDQGAHEILDTVAAEIEVWVCVGELCQRYRCLLIADGATGEVGLAEDARGVCGVVELDALVEALCLVVILNAGSTFSVSNVCAPSCS